MKAAPLKLTSKQLREKLGITYNEMRVMIREKQLLRVAKPDTKKKSYRYIPVNFINK